MPGAATDVSTADSNAAPATVGQYVRHEHFLGPVYGLTLDERETGRRVTRISYELNVLDGWVRMREWTDESGVVWAGQSTAPSRVRAVLDAAPHLAEFIASGHLMWVKALEDAGHARQASAQRRALGSALHRHGLALRTSPQRPA